MRNEAQEIFHWRCDQLRAVGLDPEAAVLVATDFAIDLHDACDLFKALVAANHDNPAAALLRILL